MPLLSLFGEGKSENWLSQMAQCKSSLYKKLFQQDFKSQRVNRVKFYSILNILKRLNFLVFFRLKDILNQEMLKHDSYCRKMGLKSQCKPFQLQQKRFWKFYEPYLIWCKQEESANGSFHGSFSRRFSLACSRLRDSRVCEIEKGWTRKYLRVIPTIWEPGTGYVKLKNMKTGRVQYLKGIHTEKSNLKS